MGVILERKTVMPYILRIIAGLCHCPEGQQFYGVELRFVLGCGEKAVQLFRYLLAGACRAEGIAEIMDKRTQILQFLLIRFIVDTIDECLLLPCDKFRHTPVGKQHELLYQPVGLP